MSAIQDPKETYDVDHLVENVVTAEACLADTNEKFAEFGVQKQLLVSLIRDRSLLPAGFFTRKKGEKIRSSLGIPTS